jgi:hypothetical protein
MPFLPFIALLLESGMFHVVTRAKGSRAESVFLLPKEREASSPRFWRSLRRRFLDIKETTSPDILERLFLGLPHESLVKGQIEQKCLIPL